MLPASGEDVELIVDEVAIVEGVIVVELDEESDDIDETLLPASGEDVELTVDDVVCAEGVIVFELDEENDDVDDDVIPFPWDVVELTVVVEEGVVEVTIDEVGELKVPKERSLSFFQRIDLMKILV